MKVFISTLSILILSFVSSYAFGQTIFMAKKGSIDFISDAPLELIEASSDKLQGVLLTDDRSFAFRVPMKSFEGFNSATQQTHFNTNYLETSKYLYTKFEGKIIEEIDFNTPGTHTVRGKGSFTCHGIKQERIIRCKVEIKPNEIKITSKFTVLLDDHNIRIPTVVNQKIAEEIMLDAIIILAPKK